MSAPEHVDRWIARLRAGISLRVPFTTTLGPETRADRSVLRAAGDAFVLETTFYEFAAGHGWSTEQLETEYRSEREIRAALAGVLVEDVSEVTG